MHQTSLSLHSFGSAEERVRKALASLRAGSGVLVVDDEDRENEGDLIFPAQTITEQQMAMLIRHCSGIVCLCITDGHAQRLDLPMMTENNTNTQQTAFTISIEAATGVDPRAGAIVGNAVGDKWLVETGLEAGDRVVTAGLQKIRPGAEVSIAAPVAAAPQP